MKQSYYRYQWEVISFFNGEYFFKWVPSKTACGKFPIKTHLEKLKSSRRNLYYIFEKYNEKIL